MKEKIIALFKQKSNGNKVVFAPPIRIRTDTDFVFVNSMCQCDMIGSTTSYCVDIEIGFDESRQINIALLDDGVLTGIWLRLKQIGNHVPERIR